MKLNWKIVGNGQRTANNSDFAFKIVTDHVGINLSVARVLEIDEWTNQVSKVGDFKTIAYGQIYSHLQGLASAFEG